MSQRIKSTFEGLKEKGEKALVIFLTAGDPDLEASLELLKSADRAGADILEVGIPFSDPVADGPVIQRASQRALKHNTSLRDVLAMVKKFRETSQTPIILFGYYNPMLSYGLEDLARDAAEAGADGFLVVNLPPEEAGEMKAHLDAASLSLIYLVSPNTREERLKRICEEASGFVYLVSMTNVTGNALKDLEPVRRGAARIRQYTDTPICVGFGISSPESAREVGACAEGAVVGSAVVRLVENRGAEAQGDVEALVSGLKGALRP